MLLELTVPNIKKTCRVKHCTTIYIEIRFNLIYGFYKTLKIKE